MVTSSMYSQAKSNRPLNMVFSYLGTVWSPNGMVANRNYQRWVAKEDFSEASASKCNCR